MNTRTVHKFSTLRHVIQVLVLAGAAAFAWSSSAVAFMINDTGTNSGGNPGGQNVYEVTGLVDGDAFNLDWGGIDGLDATAMVFISFVENVDLGGGVSANQWTINVMLSNQSTPISGSDPRITSFGLSVSNEAGDNLDSSDFIFALIPGAVLDTGHAGNFPGFGNALGNQEVDICATSGDNCAGGGSGEIAAGSADDFTFVLTDTEETLGTMLSLDAFAIKIQGGPDSQGGDSYELPGVPSEKGRSVPEPGSLVLLGTALLGTRFIRRRRRR